MDLVKKLETEEKERLYKELYEWIEITGLFPRGCSYEGEVESFINDGIAAGIEIGKAIAALRVGGEREEYAKMLEDAVSSQDISHPQRIAYERAAALLRAPVAVTVDDAMVERAKAAFNDPKASVYGLDGKLKLALSAALAGEVK